MRRFPLTAGPLLAGLFFQGATAEEITLDALADLPPADVLILGEVHDNPVHHLHQAAAVLATKPAALVFEMFGPDAALAVTPEMRDDPAALARALDWDASGWPDFSIYEPIFAAAPDAALFGGALPRDDVRRAVEDGAAAVLGGAGAIFGLDEALDSEEQEIRNAGQIAAHCDAIPAEVAPGMVEAQRARDAGLARAVIAALAETGGPVAVITGNGHARTDWGLPRMLARARPDLSVLTIGQFEAQPEGDTPYDLWLVTDPVDRPDPCEAFRR